MENGYSNSAKIHKSARTKESVKSISEVSVNECDRGLVLPIFLTSQFLSHFYVSIIFTLIKG